MKKKENNIYNELQMELSNHYSRTRSDNPDIIKTAEYKSCTGTAVGIARYRYGGGSPFFLPPSIVATARSVSHAGMDNAVKDLRQKKWQSGEYRVIVATNAFGMGIDKPDVRLVVHIDLPDSPEAYFQEAGRAGRDGKKAYAVVLYSSHDKTILTKRIADTFPPKDYIYKVYEDLQYYYQIAVGDGEGSMFEFNLEDFCRRFKFFPVPADSALKILSQAGYIEYTEAQDNSSRLLFIVGREELYMLHEMGEQSERLIQTILRSYTGIFTDYTFISETTLAVRCGMTR
jgi:Superfamily II DNA helicase